jgi:biotin-(acetyl-CoA carboxylase) ligase
VLVFKYKKELKLSNDLIVGDNIKVGGLLCEVKTVEDVFHQVPKARVRISLTIVGATKRTENAILLLARGVPIETRTYI